MRFFKMNFYADYVEGGKVYTDYEDLKKNFKIKVPENFNFSYDIITDTSSLNQTSGL